MVLVFHIFAKESYKKWKHSFSIIFVIYLFFIYLLIYLLQYGYIRLSDCLEVFMVLVGNFLCGSNILITARV